MAPAAAFVAVVREEAADQWPSESHWAVCREVGSELAPAAAAAVEVIEGAAEQ